VKLAPAEGKSEAWKRGQYMVEVLGHCGECHTPRGLPGAMQQDKRLTGGLLNGYLAPSLLATDLAARGWNQQDLSSFLKHGMSAQGTMFNEMFPVFHNSTQGLNDPDLAAMATFLLGDKPPAAKVLTEVPLEQLSCECPARASGIFERLRRLPCGGWRRQAAHRRGHARQHHAAPGRSAQPGAGDRRRYRRTEIHRVRTHAADAGFRRQAQSEQLTDLLNYLRQGWGGQSADLAVSDVQKLQAEAPPSSTRRTDMQHLDLQVVRRALEWSVAGQRVWLCTVLPPTARRRVRRARCWR
jgi:mono/diheme cytochrome c family protein